MRTFLFLALTQLMISEEELRFTNIYKKGYDISCGTAATASLLNYYWNMHIAESDLYQTMILARVKESSDTYTISFLDIMQYVQAHGIAGRAYKMDWAELVDTLKKNYAPILINYDKPQPHFALLLHLENGFAFVADPAKGFEIVDKPAFEKNYSGNALLTASRTAAKDTERISRITTEETVRLETMQGLAHSRRRW
jgi:predicted double-glycine peptidase